MIKKRKNKTKQNQAHLDVFGYFNFSGTLP